MTETAPDGSPVELYALLPERGEGELVATAVPPGATVLELGCGAGRITRQLVARGFRVTAVDESAAMLAHVRDAETVHAPIEGLELGRRLDVALLASNLVNTAEPERRHAPLAVVETLPLGWQPVDGSVSRLGEIETRLELDGVDGPVVRGRMHYAARPVALGARLSDDVLRRRGRTGHGSRGRGPSDPALARSDTWLVHGHGRNGHLDVDVHRRRW